ncbi:MAG: membrane protein insertion efficiency factor YidD [Gemmatimonadota bacterium]|nr:membrane protein insertion efficiency factor YidD [Gemmatimonadota bacterium]
MRAVIVFSIRCYQATISPWLPATCRFDPSCSEYARVAVERHGAARGSWLAARRLLRCHPFGSHGHDPVPPVAAPRAGEPSPDHRSLSA